LNRRKRERDEKAVDGSRELYLLDSIFHFFSDFIVYYFQYSRGASLKGVHSGLSWLFCPGLPHMLAYLEVSGKGLEN